MGISEISGQSFQCIGKLCCRATDKWRVINAESAETRKDAEKNTKNVALFALNTQENKIIGLYSAEQTIPQL